MLVQYEKFHIKSWLRTAGFDVIGTDLLLYGALLLLLILGNLFLGIQNSGV